MAVWHHVGLDQQYYSLSCPVTLVSTGMGDYVRVRGGATPSVGNPISVYNQPLRSTQPDHSSMGRWNDYQPKGRQTTEIWTWPSNYYATFSSN